MACGGGGGVKTNWGDLRSWWNQPPCFIMTFTVPEAALPITNTSISFLTFSGLPSILHPGLKFNNPLEFIQKATMVSFLNPIDRSPVTYNLPSFHLRSPLHLSYPDSFSYTWLHLSAWSCCPFLCSPGLDLPWPSRHTFPPVAPISVCSHELTSIPIHFNGYSFLGPHSCVHPCCPLLGVSHLFISHCSLTRLCAFRFVILRSILYIWPHVSWLHQYFAEILPPSCPWSGLQMFFPCYSRSIMRIY